MNGILISVQPQHVMNILNRDKILEIRKTMPKCELPCKVYIYCTKDRHLANAIDKSGSQLFACCNSESAFICGGYLGNGKVVAEFTLNKIDTIEVCDPDVLVNGKIVDVMEYKKNICISHDDFFDYIGYGDDHDGWGNKEWSVGYGWHIDGLKIYDEPKELSEFAHKVPDYNTGVIIYPLKKEPLKRPPQSWCYVEVNNESI